MKEFLQVNWVNGMRISSNHFIDMENHFVHRGQISMKSFVNPLNYGLMEGEESSSQRPKFSLMFNENKIKTLNGFRALTSDGYLVEIPSGHEFALAKPTTEAKSYYLLLSIRPFERVPFGLLNEEEKPLRFPNTIPEFQFHLTSKEISVGHHFGGGVLPVGKYFRSNFEEDKNYIPPCTTVSAHPKLIEFYDKMKIMLNDLEKAVLEMLAIPKIGNRYMLLNLVSFLNEHKTAFDWRFFYAPPVLMFELINKLAKTIYYTSSTNNFHFKDQNANILHAAMNFKYDHLDAYLSIMSAKPLIDNFMRFIPKQENMFGV